MGCAMLAAGCTIWNSVERIDRPARGVFDGTGPMWSALRKLRYTDRRFRDGRGRLVVDYVSLAVTSRGSTVATPVTVFLTFTADGLIERIEEQFEEAGLARLQEALSGALTSGAESSHTSETAAGSTSGRSSETGGRSLSEPGE